MLEEEHIAKQSNAWIREKREKFKKSLEKMNKGQKINKENLEKVEKDCKREKNWAHNIAYVCLKKNLIRHHY